MVRAPLVALGEAQQELRRGAGERVDRLVGVAHHGEIGRVTQPEFEQPLGERVGVLVLIDHEPALARAHGRDGRRVGLQELDRLDQHVLEVEAPGACLGPLVVAIEPGEEFRWDGRPALPILDPALGRNAPHLGPLDDIGEVLGGREAVPAGQASRQGDQELELRGQDARQGFCGVPGGPEEAQLRERGGVERARHDTRVTQRRHALDHLACRLVGEGHEQDLIGLDDAGLDGVGGTSADHPRLARACSGQDDQRTTRGPDGLALSLVEVGQQALGRSVEAGRVADVVAGFDRRGGRYLRKFGRPSIKLESLNCRDEPRRPSLLWWLVGQPEPCCPGGRRDRSMERRELLGEARQGILAD